MKRFFLLITFATLIACTKNGSSPKEENGDYIPDTSQYGDIKINQGVLFFDNKMSDYVLSYGQNEIVISSSVPENMAPVAGKILFFPLTSKTPEGFMGKVESVTSSSDSYVVKTSDVDIEDIFSELTFEPGSIDVTPYLTYLEDEQGNRYELEDGDPDIWNAISGTEESTKAGGARASKKLPFDVYGKGNIYLSIDIQPYNYIYGGKNITRVDVNYHLGLDGELGFKKEGSKVLLPLLKTPPIRIPVQGLYLLTAQVYVGVDWVIKGKASMGAHVQYELANEKLMFTNESGKMEGKRFSQNPKQGKKIEFKYLELEGETGIKAYTNISCYMWNSNVMSLGVEASTSLMLNANVSFKADDKKLLDINPEISVKPSVDIDAFVRGKIWPMKEMKKYEFNLFHGEMDQFKINLLPNFTGLERKSSNNSITAKGTLNRECFMSSPEQGYALFKKGSDAPLAHKACYMTSAPTKADTATEGEECEATFDGLVSPSDYEVKAYVVAQDGEHYYKPISSKLIESVKVGWPTDGGGWIRWDFTYDGSKLNGWTLSYSDKPYAGRMSYSYTNEGIYTSGYAYYSISLNADGNPTNSRVSMDGSTDNYSYHYVEGKLVGLSGAGNYYTYSWANGNIVNVDTNFYTDYLRVEYTDIDNKFNLNLDRPFNYATRYCYDRFGFGIPFDFIKFPGMANTKLPKKAQNGYQGNYYTFDYVLDSDGYPIEIHSTGNEHGYTISSIMYISYYEE